MFLMQHVQALVMEDFQNTIALPACLAWPKEAFLLKMLGGFPTAPTSGALLPACSNVPGMTSCTYHL